MTQHFQANDKMRSLISRDATILMALSRFSISLGFGDSSVDEVCRMHNVDTGTFLAVTNFITFGDVPESDSDIDLSSIITYLRGAHEYIIGFFLPAIRRKLTEAITVTNTDNSSFLILKYFDEYASEIASHMQHEDNTVFQNVEQLLKGSDYNGSAVSLLSAHHESLSSGLKDIKDLIIRYYPHKNSAYLNSALYDLIICENDITSHCQIEDRLFTPAVRKLEKSRRNDNDCQSQPDTDSRLQSLTDRECEIIRCVARGMSNKEIADKLCLSVNTVTTHRRNLTAKLNIHSPAALTIFAILNNLIAIDEIHLS